MAADASRKGAEQHDTANVPNHQHHTDVFGMNKPYTDVADTGSREAAKRCC